MRFESWKLYNVKLNLEIQIRQSDIRIILLILNAWAPYPVWALLIFRINAWFLHFSYPYSVWPIFWKKNRKRLKKFILERFPFFWGPIPCWGVSIAPRRSYFLSVQLNAHIFPSYLKMFLLSVDKPLWSSKYLSSLLLPLQTSFPFPRTCPLSLIHLTTFCTCRPPLPLPLGVQCIKCPFPSLPLCTCPSFYSFLSVHTIAHAPSFLFPLCTSLFSLPLTPPHLSSMHNVHGPLFLFLSCWPTGLFFHILTEI